MPSVLSQFKSLVRRKPMKNVHIFADHPGGANALVPAILKMAADGKVAMMVMNSQEYTSAIFRQAGIPLRTLADISLESMERLFKEEKPALILTGTAAQEGKRNDIIEHTAVRAARALGIPSVSVLDMWSSYDTRWSDERTDRPFDCLPDHIAVMDELAKQEMVAAGIPENIIVPTGNPFFAECRVKAKKFSNAQKNEVREKINLPHKTLFLLALDAFSNLKLQAGFWDADVLALVAQTLPKMPGIGIAVTAHPRSPDKDTIKSMIYDARVAMKFVEQIPSLDISLAADLTIVEASTVGLTAFLMGRPVISLQPDLRGEDGLILSRKKMIPVGYSLEECKDILIKSADPVWRADILNKSSFQVIEDATDRVVQLVYSLLS